MKYNNVNHSIKLYILLPVGRNFLGFSRTTNRYSTVTAASNVVREGEVETVRDNMEYVADIIRRSALPVNESLGERAIVIADRDKPNCSADIFRRWGCTDSEILNMFCRRPCLRRANADQIQFKLNILSNLGLTSTDLVKMINCRPRLLNSGFPHNLDERLEFLLTLFGSKEILRKAIIRNPSLLVYDLHKMIKPAVALYESMGVSKGDLITMLLSRPTVIPRSRLDDEKIEYIRKTGVSNDSKMYKYVVTLIAISRLETIREKLANLEKFGFSDEEVLAMCGRTPLMFTLSVDKVQRNMTFILGTMKLPAKVIARYPFLLLCNLETVLKPRVLLAGKIQEMNLDPQIRGPLFFRALRMKEKRFLKVFVKGHTKDVANELMEYYKNAKEVKRLAVASKKNIYKGFPF